MKNSIKGAWALLCLIFLPFALQAQTDLKKQGRFSTANIEKQNVNVGYTLMPAMDDHMVVMLTPDKPVVLKLRISSADGKVQIQLPDFQGNGRFVENVDLKSLKSGNYNLEILSAKNTVVQTVAFKK